MGKSSINKGFSVGGLKETIYDPNSVIVSNEDNNPIALTINENTILGRQTGENISAIPMSEIVPENMGYLTMPQISQSADYTCILTDSGKHIFHPSSDATARIFSIPANSSVEYPIGTSITFINQYGAGLITISCATDTMRLAVSGTTGDRTLDAGGIATAIKIASTEWVISGVGLT